MFTSTAQPRNASLEPTPRPSVPECFSLAAREDAVVLDAEKLEIYGLALECVFRRCQPLIPVEASHRFRLMPATHSG